MSDAVELSNTEDDIFQEACLWITRLDRGLSDNERTELRIWLQANAAHQNALTDMAELWDKTETLSSLKPFFSIEEMDQVRGTKVQKKPLGAFVAVAATCLLAVALYSYNYYGGSDYYLNAYSDEIETAMRISPPTRLPDGSLLHANIHSHILIQYTQSVRYINLIKGTINIDVAHEASRPMIVSAKNQYIRAVGTAFNVQVNENNTELIVTEGHVIVGSPENLDTIRRAKVSDNSYTSVSAGQKAELDDTQIVVKDISQSEVRVALAWRQEKLIFTGQTLEEAISEISRYTGKHFIFDDESVKMIRVSGIYSLTNIDALLISLKNNFDIDAVLDSKNNIHLKKSTPTNI